MIYHSGSRVGEVPEFGTPREDEERRDGGCAVVWDPESGLYAVGRRDKDGLLLLFSGGVEGGEDMTEGILREVREESGLYDFAHVETVGEALAHYHNRAKHVNRVAHATCLLVVLASTRTQPTKLEEHEQFVLDWATPEEIRANWREQGADGGLDHWLYFLDRALEAVERYAERARA